MSNWRLRPLMGLLLAGACSLAHASTATVYYYTPFKNWTTVFVHHNGSGTWTTAPGSLMPAACANWTSATVDFGSAANFMAVFTNGANAWDNNSNANYTVPAGIHQVKNGVLTTNIGSPCGSVVDTVAPTVPANLLSGTKTASTIDLSWTASTDLVGVTGYEIYRNGVKAGTSTTTTFTDSGLSAATTYQYTVLAFDAAGNTSELTPALSATTAVTSNLNSVTVFYKPNAAWTTTNIHYKVDGGSWTTPPGVAMDGACTGWKKKTLSLGSAAGLTAAFNNGSDWDSKSGANYVLGTGNVNVNAGAVAAGDPCGPDVTPPTQPTNVTKGAVTATSVALSWGASTDAGGMKFYKVIRNNVVVGKPTANSFVDTGLTPATPYRYRIRAFDLAGNKSPMTTEISVTTDTLDTIPPSIPLNPSAVAANTTITLNWTASTDNVGVTGYKITRTGGTQVTATLSTGNISYTDSNLNPQTNYTYSIIALDAAGNPSASSASVTAKTGDASVVPSGTPLGTDMREDSVYFVMTARFFDGDPSNNRGGSLHTSSGNAANNDPMFRGDFKGLMDRLDYIKGLGFSAIWITPVVLNRSEYDFHGYHGWDFYRVDPRLESPGASYQDLINAAHSKGIKIIQDVVYNHSSKYGAKGLSTTKYFGKRDAQWSAFYDAPNPNFEYNGLDAEPNSGHSYYNGDVWSETQPAGSNCNNWGVATGKVANGRAEYGCQWTIFGDKNSIAMFDKQFFHPCWLGNWEGEDAKSCWIHGDLPDLDTENATVQQHLIGAYNKFIGMGVDGFRIDTMVHVHRNMWNKHFLPAAQQESVLKFGEKGKNFYMVGEVGAFVNDKWNHGSPGHSPQFYTWKERKTYSSDDAVAVKEMTAFEQAAAQPTSTNAFLQGNNYHAPDLSQCNGASVIDMRMHMNFGSADNAFQNGKDSDDSYCDATYNMVYVDAHDFAPGKSDFAYAGGTDAWAENMSLMWTFRGIPTIFQGAEIEFQAGKKIDCGGSCPLATTRRAYFGSNLEGSVTATDFGVVSSASGTVATTLSAPLAKHLQRLNQIRRKIPALQKGQYSTEGVSGGMAYKRRYTTGSVDSFVVVAISGGATFSGIPNGTYKDAVTGDVKNVSNGTLTAALSGKGNARIYVLDTALTPAPGKIGADGPFLKP